MMQLVIRKDKENEEKRKTIRSLKKLKITEFRRKLFLRIGKRKEGKQSKCANCRKFNFLYSKARSLFSREMNKDVQNTNKKKDNVWLWKIVFSYLLLYITWLHFIRSWFCSNFKYTSITVFQWHFKEIIEWNVNSVKSIINLQWKCQIMGNLGYISYRLEMRFFFGVQYVLSIFTFLIKQSDLLFLRSKANTQELEKEKGPHLSVPIMSYCDSQLMRTNKNIHVHFDRFYW